ncbi:MAG: tetratricopeptide repeat protein [Bdellovibrionales bacterium]|nr:tetratricopeptide repeat protein [Bdellovibrionales bacterium]
MLLRVIIAIFVVSGSGCTVQSSISNHYLMAEKLWTEKNYPAAVSEFDFVVKEAPNSAIGLQSLWRAAMTRELFLGQSEEALRNFELFLERASGSDLAPQAQLEIGEILFSKLALYQKAIDHYQKLLDLKKFSHDEESRFVYRIARGYFLLNQIRKSQEWYERGLKDYSSSTLNPKMKFDLAHTWYALGENDKAAYAKALKVFQDLALSIRTTDHRLYVQSIFGEASTWEELDEFEKAYALFESIQSDYPAPNVVKVRMHRLSERIRKKRK